jgi:hypothetical protein
MNFWQHYWKNWQGFFNLHVQGRGRGFQNCTNWSGYGEFNTVIHLHLFMFDKTSISLTRVYWGGGAAQKAHVIKTWILYIPGFFLHWFLLSLQCKTDDGWVLRSAQLRTSQSRLHVIHDQMWRSLWKLKCTMQDIINFTLQFIWLEFLPYFLMLDYNVYWGGGVTKKNAHVRIPWILKAHSSIFIFDNSSKTWQGVPVLKYVREGQGF